MENKVSANYKDSDNKEVVENLSKFLANLAIVYYKTHGFHWNVKGENFYSLHLMFEKFYTKLWKSMDEVAERMRALNAIAPPNYVELLQKATIKENETAPQGHIMVQILLDDYLELANQAHQVSKVATTHGDLVTADMMIRKANFLEKAAWMLHSSITD